MRKYPPSPRSSAQVAARVIGPTVALSLLLAGCTDKADAGADAIDVKASDTACELATTEASTGTVTFNITNTGSKVNEFYINTENGRVIG